MDRREFLTGLCGALGAVTSKGSSAAPLKGDDSVTFFVAGARFHNVKLLYGSKCPSGDFLIPSNHLDSMGPILIRGGASIVDGQEPGEVQPRSLEISERPDR